ncbi:hypothetical protein D918_03436 [Trichuris suis]|nr:hypothetical protein D918_03436 [Trichuris suis]
MSPQQMLCFQSLTERNALPTAAKQSTRLLRKQDERALSCGAKPYLKFRNSIAMQLSNFNQRHSRSSKPTWRHQKEKRRICGPKPKAAWLDDDSQAKKRKMVEGQTN